MCGRFHIDFENKEIQKMLKTMPPQDIHRISFGDIYPSNHAPILAAGIPPAAARWGYERFDKKGLLINARAETVTEKPTFRKDFFERRCLIPADGFYEWTQDKRKIYFRGDFSAPLLLGGIFRKNRESAPDFVILTKSATPPVDAYHDRIPILIDYDFADFWLNDIDFAVQTLSRTNRIALHAAE